MATIYAEIKDIYTKYFSDDSLVWEGKSDFKSLDQSNPDIAKLTELETILESRGETNPYLLTLYKKLALTEADEEASDKEDSLDAFNAALQDVKAENAESSEGDENQTDDSLGPNEDTFANKYPNVDEKEVLKKCYVSWLDAMTTKPFFKTISSFYELAKINQLNFIDRSFLWNFLKAISSCITHLLIEGAQREEAICLVDTYFDSLNDCLQTTIHAKSKDDVIQAFLYMISFLGLNRDIHSEIQSSAGQDEDTTNKDEKGSVGEF